MDGTMIKEKLEAYRRKKRKEEMLETIKYAIQVVLPWNGNATGEELMKDVPKDLELQDVPDTESTCSEESVDEWQCSMLTKVKYLLYFLLWITLYAIAIKFEFGAVYFVLSTLVFIWFNTHSRPKKEGELSAYSVFNPNCEAIDGTLDASQFEREIRYGIGFLR